MKLVVMVSVPVVVAMTHSLPLPADSSPRWLSQCGRAASLGCAAVDLEGGYQTLVDDSTRHTLVK